MHNLQLAANQEQMQHLCLLCSFPVVSTAGDYADVYLAAITLPFTQDHLHSEGVDRTAIF